MRNHLSLYIYLVIVGAFSCVMCILPYWRCQSLTRKIGCFHPFFVSLVVDDYFHQMFVSAFCVSFPVFLSLFSHILLRATLSFLTSHQVSFLLFYSFRNSENSKLTILLHHEKIEAYCHFYICLL